MFSGVFLASAAFPQPLQSRFSFAQENGHITYNLFCQQIWFVAVLRQIKLDAWNWGRVAQPALVRCGSGTAGWNRQRGVVPLLNWRWGGVVRNRSSSVSQHSDQRE